MIRMNPKKFIWTLLVSVWCLSPPDAQGLDYAVHIGCFKNNLNEFENQFVSNDGLVLREKLTPQVCVNYCKSKGYKYAVLHSSIKCFCSNSRTQFNISADISDCYYRCDGNRNEICGGPYRLSVYKVYDELSNNIEKNYIGCFLDGGTRERIFATKIGINQTYVTPEACIGFCYRKEYKYAGITNRFLCSCDNQLGTKRNEELCSKCSSDGGINCSGKMYMRLYYATVPS